MAAGVLAAVLVLLSAGVVLRSRRQDPLDESKAQGTAGSESEMEGGTGNVPAAVPIDSHAVNVEGESDGTAADSYPSASLAFVAALDKERRGTDPAAPKHDAPTPERRASFAEDAGVDELSRLHALGTANVRDAVNERAVSSTNGNGNAEDTFDSAMLQLTQHGAELRVQSTRRANPLYRGSVYEEADRVGVSEL